MTVTIHTGDCRSILPTLEAGSVQTCVTSPPYFGLRDYGTADWDGGDPDCDHAHIKGGNGASSAKQVTSTGTQAYQYSGSCPKCGAVRVDQQIGLEPTVDAYVAELVAVFRDVRRVLADDGTLWLVIGDSYATHAQAKQQRPRSEQGNGAGKYKIPAQSAIDAKWDAGHTKAIPTGLKDKDLIGVPWRVAFALQADGWYLRSEIIWAKPNPMPESVTDRPTKAHEQIFLLTKSARYMYDAAAIAEPSTPDMIRRAEAGHTRGGTKVAKERNDAATLRPAVIEASGRNKRSVWPIATQPYSAAHFATFPPKLIEPCILAGSRPGDTVLDPFGGSGTTGAVAERFGRDAILIELNPEYKKLIETRTAQRGLSLDVA